MNHFRSVFITSAVISGIAWAGAVTGIWMPYGAQPERVAVGVAITASSAAVLLAVAQLAVRDRVLSYLLDAAVKVSSRDRAGAQAPPARPAPTVPLPRAIR